MRTTRTLGIVTVVAGLLGAATAAVVIAWPAQVGDERYSYPFDAAGYTAAQSFFAVHHLGMLAGLWGLVLLTWSSAGRWTRAGLVTAILGTVVLTACELFAITARNAAAGSPEADTVDNAYGLPMILIGAGLVVAGIGLVRPVGWVPLLLGVYVFVPLFPAVFGPVVAGRIAIGVWMLLFAALGAVLLRRNP